MPIYNKLVRDRIPEIIEGKGKSIRTRILNEEEYIDSLKNKLQEEVNEYLAADNDQEALEELADLLELIRAVTKIHDSSIEQVEKIRREKSDQRGSFHNQVYLVEVED
ncbi:nucleoside triphosphate pyrophosphohydrolase [Halobacillus shinanisalinarum]|uniref:Nucleoside triphosphate pyrophosphohydrolase n=1 Tax=Halobacillus shinanisalinarum TaxID=2932258 RepID=A0ABY4GVH2_9BACI|nr:nucleoside triphosphate pyrophosphohydrolase [Halobacillus shinanisalinarum]UOQ92143.1 nucleoside triphosphate pyrophosphohydrolase [Halobacillus shinanisalinarum]